MQSGGHHPDHVKHTNRTSMPRTYPLSRNLSDNYEDDSTPPPSYLYPSTRNEQSRNDPINNKVKGESKRFERSSSREEDHIAQMRTVNNNLHNNVHRSVSREEQEIKPIIIRPRNFDSRFKNILNDDHDLDEDNDMHLHSKSRHALDDDDHHIPVEKYSTPPPPQNVGKQRVTEPRKYRQADGTNKEKRYFDEVDQPQIKDREAYRYMEKDHRRSMDHVPRTDVGYNDKNDDDLLEYRENLTDKQKYRESLLEKQKHIQSRYSSDRYIEHDVDSGEFYNNKSVPRHGYSNEQTFEKNRMPLKSKSKYDNPIEKIPAYKGETTIERSGYRPKSTDKNLQRSYSDKTNTGDHFENSMHRNPYKEADSLPYRESIEKMIKSPVMRYNSFDDSSLCDIAAEEEAHSYSKSYSSQEKNRFRESGKYHVDSQAPMYQQQPPQHLSRRRIIENHKNRSQSRSPETISKVSPKDRFHDAKEKFQAMERERTFIADKSHHQNRQMEPARRSVGEARANNGLFEYPPVVMQRMPPQHDRKFDWSSEDDQPQIVRRSSGYRDGHSGQPTSVNAMPVDRYMDKKPSRVQGNGNGGGGGLGPAKSLGNLVKGYRHSYAEPRNNHHPLPRNSGRVGLAAVNPF